MRYDIHNRHVSTICVCQQDNNAFKCGGADDDTAYKKIKQGHRQILVSYQHGHIIEALKYRELAKYETEFMMSFSMWMSRGVAQLEH